MRQTVRFFLNSTIAFFVVLVNTLMIQLILNAPMPVGGQVAGLQVQSLFIPGQALSCTQAGQQNQQQQCKVSLFDRPLELALTSSPHQVKQCQLSYAGRTADCKGNFHTLIVGGWLPVISTDSNLGLSAEQIATLRQEYPQRNFFLHTVGEDRLLQLPLGIAIAAGVLTFLFGWLNRFGEQPCFVVGLFVCGITWVISTGMIWALGYVD